MRGGGAEIALYLGVTFGITWSLAAVVIGLPDWFAAHFGPLTAQSPIFYLAVWAPNIAALALTAAREGGAGLKDLFARLLRWRAPLWVWGAALGFYPALMALVQLIHLVRGEPVMALGDWAAALIGLFSVSALLLGPLGEELGWRGYLLPRVLARVSAAWAALIVGAIWMAWHIPAFLVSGLPQSGMAFWVFMAAGTALSVDVTWLFVHARQSILIAGILPHAIVNAYGEASGDMTWIDAGVLVAGAALLIVVLGPRLGAATSSYR